MLYKMIQIQWIFQGLYKIGIQLIISIVWISIEKASLVHHTDDESDGDRNRERENNSEDPRPERPDYRQNQKIPRTAPNTRYYNFFNYF